MDNYLQSILDEAPHDVMGTAITPATNRLFDVRSTSEKLDKEKAEEFHHVTARLLYLCKHGRPDIRPPYRLFLCTRVREPDVDDWKKLC